MATPSTFTTSVSVYQPRDFAFTTNSSIYRSKKSTVELAREFEKTGYLYAKSGQDFDEQGEVEQALQHYVHAIEYFLAAARFETEPLRGVLRKQISAIVERSEKLKIKEKRQSLSPRASVKIECVDEGLSLWEMVDPEEEQKSAFSFDATIVENSHPNYSLVRAILSGMDSSLRDSTMFSSGLIHDIPTHEFHMVKEYPMNIGNKSYIFVDYAPTVFLRIRNLFGGASGLMRSIFSSQTLQTIKSPGKSSSFFYFSQDKKFIMKSVPLREADFLKSILIPYYNHSVNNPHSLLVKFLGFFSIQSPGEQVVYFVAMENIINPNLPIQEGSTHGRFVKEKEKRKPNVVWKDLDIPQGHLKLSLEDKRIFSQQLAADSTFLQNYEIMDYSLLVAVHHLPGFEYHSNNATGNYFRKDSGGKQIASILWEL